MASPVVAATNESAGASSTTQTVALPSGIVAGDLLIIELSLGGNTSVTNWNGFTALAEAADRFAGYKWATGSEGATVDITIASAFKGAHISYRISGAENPSTQAPEISSAATASSTTPDPSTVTPTGGSKDYLFIAFFGCRGATEELDDDTWCNSAPSGYGGLLQKTTGTSGTGNCYLASAHLAKTASSEDPGTFDMDQSNTWEAFTIAVHPAAATTKLIVTTMRGAV